jgi:hypothetical protein
MKLDIVCNDQLNVVEVSGPLGRRKAVCLYNVFQRRSGNESKRRQFNETSLSRSEAQVESAAAAEGRSSTTGGGYWVGGFGC